MYEICVNLTCTRRTPVNSEHKKWSKGGSVYTDFTLHQ